MACGEARPASQVRFAIAFALGFGLAGASDGALVGRALSIASVALSALSCLVWLVNAAEIGILRPTNCSMARLQFESWLLLARAAAMVTPVLGLAAALIAFGSPPRWRNAALAGNALALAFVALIFAGFVPLGHLPCLRN